MWLVLGILFFFFSGWFVLFSGISRGIHGFCQEVHLVGEFSKKKRQKKEGFFLQGFRLQGTLILLVALGLFEQFPISNVACGVIAQIVHFVILKDFPFVSLTSPVFILGVTFIIINHYLAFSFFANVYYSFTEVLITYFCHL